LLLTWSLGCGAVGSGGSVDRSQVRCGDGLCPVGQTCLGACYGVPPETLTCIDPLPDLSCPIGTLRSTCRNARSEVVSGCRPAGRCVEVRKDCSTTTPSCGCFLQNPCSSGPCHDERGQYTCPPCA